MITPRYLVRFISLVLVVFLGCASVCSAKESTTSVYNSKKKSNARRITKEQNTKHFTDRTKLNSYIRNPGYVKSGDDEGSKLISSGQRMEDSKSNFYTPTRGRDRVKQRGMKSYTSGGSSGYYLPASELNEPEVAVEREGSKKKSYKKKSKRRQNTK